VTERSAADEPVSAERAEVAQTPEVPVGPTRRGRVPTQMD
jgi:hypothetical protein